MDHLLRKVRNIIAEGCVTISLNTHKTRPSNLKDDLQLRNMVKEAKLKLAKHYGKEVTTATYDQLKTVLITIDHSKNIESLMLFANKDFADYLRLPIKVTNKVLVGHTFSTREIIRALQMRFVYYILVLNKQKARFITAANGTFLKENQSEFPMENPFTEALKFKKLTSDDQGNLIEEFFNRVCKVVVEILEGEMHPLIVATEMRNYAYCTKVADSKMKIAGHLKENCKNLKNSTIVVKAWHTVVKEIIQEQELKPDELKRMRKSKQFVSDLNDIWSAIRSGKGKTLIVNSDYYQASFFLGDEIFTIDTSKNGNTDLHVDDIVSELIEQNQHYGGDTIFFKDDELLPFKIGLIKRY